MLVLGIGLGLVQCRFVGAGLVCLDRMGCVFEMGIIWEDSGGPSDLGEDYGVVMGSVGHGDGESC
jgi:hypothetical protein